MAYGDDKTQEELEAEAVERARLARETEIIALRQLNQPASLKEIYARLMVKHHLEPGMIVDWKPGLRNRTLYGPFVVVEVLQVPLRLDGHSGIAADSASFLDTVDVRLLMRSSEQGAFSFMLDSNRLQPVPVQG